MNDENYDERKELKKVIANLKEKREHLDNMIGIAQMIQETGININTLRHGISGLENLKADIVFRYLGTVFNNSINLEWDEVFNEEALTEEELEIIFTIFEAVLTDCDAGKKAKDVEVQKKIAKMHSIAMNAMTESVVFYSGH